MPNVDEVEYSQEKPPNQECSICLEEVDANDVKDGVPNCVTCKNSHFIHRSCFDKMTNHKCPICRENVKYNCRGYQGYIKPNRKGGFKRSIKRSKKRSKSVKSSKSVKRSRKKRSKTKRSKR